MQDTVIIALGGSLLYNESAVDLKSWKVELIELIRDVIGLGMKIVIVVGGGKLARENIIDAKNQGISEKFELDLVGIKATRKNARDILELFSNANISINQKIPRDISDGVSCFNNSKVIVMGGTVPGHTSDAVAIRMGKELESKMVIIATNVTHVYTSDPKFDSNASPIESMTLKELGVLSGVGGDIQPGSSFAVDPIGVGIAIENNLPLAILDGSNIENLRKSRNLNCQELLEI